MPPNTTHIDIVAKIIDIVTNVTFLAASLAFFASLASIAVTLRHGGLKHFAEQKWWERKAEAYIRLIDALGDMINLYDVELREAHTEKYMPRDKKDELRAQGERGKKEFQKAKNMGAFIISEDAEAALDKFAKRYEGLDSGYYMYEEADYQAAITCRKELIACAKKELKIK